MRMTPAVYIHNGFRVPFRLGVKVGYHTILHGLAHL